MAPEVETRSGRIRGADFRGIRTFHGIPFARPPVGPLRFRAPEPPEPWTGIRSATSAGNVSVQASLPALRFLNAGGSRQSEDCLYLNVWTPALDGGKRPVLVWIHGGGFLIGAGSTPVYDGRGLSRRGDMVVVTVNYRLGALGYLHLSGVGGEEFRGATNAGVRDQIAALEWVRDNIAGFGGDSGNVTVCGQSAGAMSIGALLGAPRARNLFHRAICQSGAAHNVVSQDRADEIAEVFLGALGGPARTRDALARIPIARIKKAQLETNRRLASLEQLMVFVPAVDGDLIPEPPLAAIRRGATAHIPILNGTTLDEWKLFSPIDASLPSMTERALIARFEAHLPHVSGGAPEAPEAAWQYREAVRARGGRTSPFEVWNAFQSARVFHYPASILSQAQCDAGGPSFTYLFTWRPPALRRTLGACHAMDIPFVFGLTRHPFARPFSSLTRSADGLTHNMQQAWIQFARSGRPGHAQLPAWDPYTAETRATMVFGRSCYLADAPLEAERRLWERWA